MRQPSSSQPDFHDDLNSNSYSNNTFNIASEAHSAGRKPSGSEMDGGVVEEIGKSRPSMTARPSFNLTLPEPSAFLYADPSSPPNVRTSPFATTTPPRLAPTTPWHALAASSGAPTPSIESGPSMRGNSPHLGYPFERLNIGGSWSGANLFSDAQPVPDVKSPGTPSGPIGGMSLETLKRYRSQAGKTPLEEPGFKLNLPAAVAIKTMPPPKTGSPVKPSPKSLSKLQPISATSLKPMISSPNVLVLDIRPPSSFQASHVKSSHSLPIPSTLLRRAAFTLPKMVQMLPPPSVEEVGQWKEKSDIVLVDQDSGTAPEGSILKGLASKFERESFSGKLWFVKGGFTSLRSSGCELDGYEDAPDLGPADEKGLRAGRLGRLAFEQESTGSGLPQTPSLPLNVSTPRFSFMNNPFDTKTEASGSSSPTASRASSGSSRTTKLQPANPFFDNIRQNLELSHGGITERIPLNLPSETVKRAPEMPAWLADLVTMDEKDSTEQLAKQFYEIELGEQKRLQNVMEWHSRGSGGILDDDAGKGGRADNKRAEQRNKDAQEVDRLAAWGEGYEGFGEDYFPFSITAGVERGTKNRYKNIWPYDFSRVRLSSPSDDDSDYINASFVQPRGTSRRYIATQGPLDATFRDFWTLIWEQGVRVIVMLTKQYEGGLLKCGNYWEDQTYGHMRLQFVSQDGGDDAVDKSSVSGFNFGHQAPSTATKTDEENANIKRVFMLRHDGQPSEPPRKIVQIQCVTWPDFDVPDSPEILLNLIKDVDQAMEQVPSTRETEADDDRKNKPPVLVHCSAGVGRTGSFIVVDAILDALRREKAISDAASSANDVLTGSSSKGSFSPRPKAPSIVTGGSGGSRSSGADSIKSVSFQTPAPFQHSKPSVQAPMPSTSQAAADDFMQATGAPTSKMEVDSPDDVAGPSSEGFRFGFGSDDQKEHTGFPLDDPKFSQWREERRPSLASTYSSERTSYEILPAETPITKSNVPHRSPSPLSAMKDPIADVLEGMRVQRMSLVQSLRQYLFVHRAIIHHYLSMVDESKPSNDEENHIKRRASPTDLMETQESDNSVEMVRGGSGLSKRPSFKKMRATAVEGFETPGTPTRGGSPPSTSLPPSSPAKSARKRFSTGQ